MEGNFRNTLIILSAVIIAVIFIHGFITIRRNKNPYKLKATNEKIEPLERGFDGSGFDQDGVSKPRVKNGKSTELPHSPNKTTIQDPSFSSLKKEPTYNVELVDETLNNKDHDDNFFDYEVDEKINEKVEVNVAPASIDQSTSKQDISLTDAGIETLGSSSGDVTIDIGDDIEGFDYGAVKNPDSSNSKNLDDIEVEPKVNVKPLYQTPITQPKPDIKDKITSGNLSNSSKKPLQNSTPINSGSIGSNKKTVTNKKASVRRNQIELNFGDPIDSDKMPSMSAIDEPSKIEKKQSLEPLEPEVLVVSVVMPQGEVISGAELLPILLTLGLRYGDMDIFHRHQDNAGNGKVTFSLANIMNPGTFDLDALENFSTCGLTLFMTLPNAGDAFEVFEHMLGAAKQISLEFSAQLLDDKRSVMTKQTEQHYMSKIREFERKNRIALSLV